MKKIIPLLTAVLSFLLGAFWYSEYFLGKVWQRAVGFKPSNDNMMGPMVISFMLMIVMAYGMQWLMQRAKVSATYAAGFKFGLMIALFFVVTSLGIVYVYSGKAAFATLWAIDAGYQATLLTLMGTILAGFSRKKG